MTKLIGSEKQVKWAEEIREAKLAEFRQYVEEAAVESGATEAERDDMLNTVTELALGQTYAAWWIDIRGMADIGAVLDKLDVDAMIGRGREKRIGTRTLFG